MPKFNIKLQFDTNTKKGFIIPVEAINEEVIVNRLLEKIIIHGVSKDGEEYKKLPISTVSNDFKNTFCEELGIEKPNNVFLHLLSLMERMINVQEKISIRENSIIGLKSFELYISKQEKQSYSKEEILQKLRKARLQLLSISDGIQ